MSSVTLNKKHSSKQVVSIRKVVFAVSEGVFLFRQSEKLCGLSELFVRGKFRIFCVDIWFDVIKYTLLFAADAKIIS